MDGIFINIYSNGLGNDDGPPAPDVSLLFASMVSLPLNTKHYLSGLEACSSESATREILRRDVATREERYNISQVY